MLAHVQPGVHRDFQVLFCRAALQLGSSWPALVRVVPPQVQDSALRLVEHPEIVVSPFLQSVKVPLDGNMTFWHISHSFQFSVIHKLAEGTHCPVVYISKILNRTGLNIDLWDKPPTGLQLWATDLPALGLAIQPVLSLLQGLLLQSVLHQLLCEDVMGDNGKSLVGDKIENIHCSALMQSFYIRRSLVKYDFPLVNVC